MLSPLLFVLFIGESVTMLHEAGCNGIYINEQAPNIMILLFADDIAICGDTVGRLKEMIKTLENYTKRWGIKVNMDKTKIIVFRRGGQLRGNESFSFMKEKIEIVNEYKYLGVYFTTKLKWSKATKTLAQQASKALHMLYVYERKCDGLPGMGSRPSGSRPRPRPRPELPRPRRDRDVCQTVRDETETRPSSVRDETETRPFSGRDYIETHGL